MRYYYRLYDYQTGGYLHTGYNTTSLKQLKDQLFDYIKDDVEEEDHFSTRICLDVFNMFRLVLDIWEFGVERSRVKFEPNEGPVSEWPKHYKKYGGEGVTGYEMLKEDKWVKA